MSAPSPDPVVAAPRVLVVDDEASVRRVCTFALRAEGWQAAGEESPRAALARLVAGERFDALVLDYAMPELDGLALLRACDAELGAGARPPVLLASAHADGAVALEALGLGVWDFLAKPLTPEELRGRLGRLLRREAAARAGDVGAKALLFAAGRRWAEARAALEGLAGERDALIRGLLFQLEGDEPAAAGCFAAGRWWAGWQRQGHEIWTELARRLDGGE